MTNVITELDQQLASLNQLKPPGASKGKIGSITQLCVSNIQVEMNIVQSLYRAVKKAPATHKLGALYVVDSVVRQWIEKAKQNGQELVFEGRGEPGTYPAAVKRVTELLPVLFDDTAKGIPEDQKPKLINVINIWEKGNTFPAKMMGEFKAKLTDTSTHTNGTAASDHSRQGGEKFMAPIPTRPSHTPVGYPPQHLYDRGLIPPKKSGQQAASTTMANGTVNDPSQAPSAQPQAPPTLPAPPAQPSGDVNSILAALAGAVPQAPAAPLALAPPPFFATNGAAPMPPNLTAYLQNAGIQLPQSQPPAFPTPVAQQPLAAPPFQLPPGFPIMPPQLPPSVSQSLPIAPPPPQPAAPADPLAPLRSILPPNILNDQGKLVAALQLLQDLQKQGLPMSQWGPVLKALDDTQQLDAHSSKDRRRSRSPDRGRGRASPVYGTYEEIAAKKKTEEERMDRNGGNAARGRYRQRSPIQSQRDVTMRDSPLPMAMNGMPMQPKNIFIDKSLPPDHIKVLSRTLFVGGASGTQQEIQQLFERFGRVQTCIANRDKRHAFVKMTTREYALNAKAGMEELQERNDREVMAIARQTKWGVGFGPRECCDYQKGESVIPIHKLTEADIKWLMTAEYGGTGGKTLEGGMVLEEPDIEIGAGVSSKAMSKRVMPDAGPPPSSNKRAKEERRQHGQYGRRHNDYDREPAAAAGYGGGGYSGIMGGGAGGGAPVAVHQHAHQPPPMQMESYGYDRPVRPEPVAVATPPAVPTFGFSLPQAGQAFR